MEPCPSAIFQRRAAELPGKDRREFTLIFVAHLCRDLGHPQFGVPQQFRSPAELMERGGLYRRMVELQSESAQWRLNGAEV